MANKFGQWGDAGALTSAVTPSINANYQGVDPASLTASMPTTDPTSGVAPGTAPMSTGQMGAAGGNGMFGSSASDFTMPSASDTPQYLADGGVIADPDSDGDDDSSPAGDTDNDAGNALDPSSTSSPGDVSDALNAIQDALQYGRKMAQNGPLPINMPSKPAGPGGDQPNDNPFSTKTAPIPFGRRGAPAQMGSNQEDDDASVQSAADGGVIQDPGDEQGPDTEQASQEGQGQGPNGLVGYIMGAGAVDPDTAAAAEQQVDPQGQMDPAQRKIMAIASQPDVKSRFSLMQHYRQKFNGYSAFARAALDGIPGKKPGDLAASTQAANQAYENVPTGKKMTFVPGRGGVDLHVADIGGGKKSQSFDAGGGVDGVDDDSAAEGQTSDQSQTPVPDDQAPAQGQDQGQGDQGGLSSYLPSMDDLENSTVGQAVGKVYHMSVQGYKYLLEKLGQFDNLFDTGPDKIAAHLDAMDSVQPTQNDDTIQAGGGTIGGGPAGQGYRTGPPQQQAPQDAPPRNFEERLTRAGFDKDDIATAKEMFPNAFMNRAPTADTIEATQWLNGQRQQSTTNKIAQIRAENPLGVMDRRVQMNNDTIAGRDRMNERTNNTRDAMNQRTNDTKDRMNERTVQGRDLNNQRTNNTRLSIADLARGKSPDFEKLVHTDAETIYKVNNGNVSWEDAMKQARKTQLQKEVLKRQGGGGQPQPQQPPQQRIQVQPQQPGQNIVVFPGGPYAGKKMIQNPDGSYSLAPGQ